MHRGTSLLYILLGLLALLVSTAWSQRNNTASQNAPTGTLPRAQATSSKISKKGIFFSIPRPTPTAKANPVTQSEQEGITDVPEEQEIGEDPTTSADGLTQRTESNLGTDPVEQRDTTKPMAQPPTKQQQPVAPAAAVSPKATNKFVRKTSMPIARVPIITPAPRPAIPRDPIVHARRTTPEPKELDVETTTSYYYYNDYYNYNNHYNNGFDGKNGSGTNQEATGDSTCPVFKETIMEHHVILRRDGCEICKVRGGCDWSTRDAYSLASVPTSGVSRAFYHRMMLFDGLADRQGR